MSFHSLEEIVSAAEQQKKPFFRIVLEDDMSERMVSEEESFLAMQAMYSAMYSADGRSDGKSAENGRVQCVYETDCGGSHCRLLRSDAGSISDLSELFSCV